VNSTDFEGKTVFTGERIYTIQITSTITIFLIFIIQPATKEKGLTMAVILDRKMQGVVTGRGKQT
jgi:hypothetical protein